MIWEVIMKIKLALKLRNPIYTSPMLSVTKTGLKNTLKVVMEKPVQGQCGIKSKFQDRTTQRNPSSKNN